MSASGYATKAGVKLGQTWGSAWAAVDTVIPFVSENITKKYDELRSNANIGQAAEHGFSNGIQNVAGDLVFEIPYGIANVATLLSYGFGAYASGVATMDDDLSDQMFHLEVDKVTKRYRFRSCVVNKLTIAGEIGSGKPLEATMSVIAYLAEVTSDAFPSISLATSGAARVFPDHAIPSNGYLLVGDCANALAAGDSVGFKSFEFMVDHGLKADDKSSVSAYVLEPLRSARRKVEHKYVLPRFSATEAAFTTWRDSNTMLQAALRFYDPVGATYFQIRSPRAYVASGADFNVSGADVIGGEVTLTAHYNGSGGSALNSYMTVTDQAEIEFSAL